MRLLATIAACATLVLPIPSDSVETKLELKDLQNHPFAVDCPSDSNLRLHLRSGEFRIIGRADNKLSVRLEGRNANNAQDLTVRYKRFGNDAELRIYGGPKNNLEVTVEVPASSMLFVRMPAGDLSIEGVSGDKDVELHAGELTISVGDAATYGHVDASVVTGGLEAPPFHESHGGLFRSFEKHGTGKYTLHAHVGAGDLTLR
jgi:hypothetical protein